MRIAENLYPPNGDDNTDDLSIHDLIGELRDPIKTIFIELVNNTQLTVMVNGYTTYEGDIHALRDYSPQTHSQFFELLRTDDWDYHQYYAVSGIGNPQTSPRKERQESWLRWL
ncbi:MAG: hypothetical protein KJ043_10560 [Anaerolineae bacterium]|nr:hypothetical protein [Anaerolineae bacterium]